MVLDCSTWAVGCTHTCSLAASKVRPWMNACKDFRRLLISITAQCLEFGGQQEPQTVGRSGARRRAWDVACLRSRSSRSVETSSTKAFNLMMMMWCDGRLLPTMRTLMDGCICFVPIDRSRGSLGSFLGPCALLGLLQNRRASKIQATSDLICHVHHVHCVHTCTTLVCSIRCLR